MKSLPLLLLAAALAAGQPAQRPNSANAPTGTVSGHVYDADSGAPIKDFPIARDARTDDQGRYTLHVPAGPQQIALRGERMYPDLAVRSIIVEAGADITGIDFRIRLDGEISGRVIDDNKDPVMGMPVHLIGREYSQGALRYFTDNRAVTNDRGEYHLKNLRAGRAVMLLAETAHSFDAAVSDAPPDPKLRQPVYRATYYPSSDSVQGAAPITLRSGEHRENVDIQVLRTPSYCLDAILLADGAPAGLNFKLSDELTSSAYVTPGTGSSGPLGVGAGPDGKIRLCGLYPSQYRLAALRRNGPGGGEVFGSTMVTIGKEDVHGIRVFSSAPATVQGEVVWEGTPPESTTPPQFAMGPRAISNDSMVMNRPRSPVPGPFTFTMLPTVEYTFQYGLSPQNALPNAYVKEVTYGDAGVLHQPFHLLGDARMRVVLANDAGSLKVTAVDKDGKPSAGVQILILPPTAASEALLVDMMVAGLTGPDGSCLAPRLRPGKYVVLGIDTLIDSTPESIAALWRDRFRGKEVEVGPNATASITVESKPLQ